LGHRGDFDVLLRLGLLDAAFDIANGVGVLLDLGLGVGREFLLQAGKLWGYRIENVLVLKEARFAGLPAGAAAVAEEFFKDGARVPFLRDGLGGAEPGKGMGVDAGQVAGAGAGVGEFEGGLAADFGRVFAGGREMGADGDAAAGAGK